MEASSEFQVRRLGECGLVSPLESNESWRRWKIFVNDSEKVAIDIVSGSAEGKIHAGRKSGYFEKAGPREKIYFDPVKTRAAIVTCGGICPGINDVIRSVVMTLFYRYGVKEIFGIRNGYQGMVKKSGLAPIRLSPFDVDHINHTGGTILGTSRGQQDSNSMLEFLRENRINQLFVIGGDGTMRGALELSAEAEKQKYELSVIGIPKTVDNDILCIDRSFGFISAMSAAGSVVEIAHNEAKSQFNGIGLVKLMGRNSGFITCFADLASGNANFVLIPEVPFDLEGEKGFLKALELRLKHREHAVILVAEGAGQEHMPSKMEERDASGNVKFKDIGIFLRDKINSYFQSKKIEVNLKYIDPSYIVRAIGATAADSAYCFMLGKNAVHAAMSGRTQVVVGLVHNIDVHIPMKLITHGRRQVDPNGSLWSSVLESIGQPVSFKNE
jgi:6-phosphofructokinase 1